MESGLEYKIKKKSSFYLFLFFLFLFPLPPARSLPPLNAHTHTHHRPGPGEDSQILPGIEAGTRRGTESSLPVQTALLPRWWRAQSLSLSLSRGIHRRDVDSARLSCEIN